MKAGPGMLFVCGVCGRTSPTWRGDPDAGRAAMDGWTEHCWATSKVLPEAELVRHPTTGLVFLHGLVKPPT